MKSSKIENLLIIFLVALVFVATEYLVNICNELNELLVFGIVIPVVLIVLLKLFRIKFHLYKSSKRLIALFILVLIVTKVFYFININSNTNIYKEELNKVNTESFSAKSINSLLSKLKITEEEKDILFNNYDEENLQKAKDELLKLEIEESKFRTYNNWQVLKNIRVNIMAELWNIGSKYGFDEESYNTNEIALRTTNFELVRNYYNIEQNYESIINMSNMLILYAGIYEMIIILIVVNFRKNFN